MYGTVTGVAALVPGLAGSGFDASSTPTDDQVETWLGEAYSQINLALSKAGYVVPVSASADAYATLTALEDLYGAAYALRARAMETHHDEEERLSEVYLKDFTKRLMELVKGDLTGMGLTLRTTTKQRLRRLRSLQVRRVDGYSATYGPERGTYVAGEEDSD